MRQEMLPLLKEIASICPEGNNEGDSYRRSYRQCACFGDKIKIQSAIMDRTFDKSHRTLVGPGTDCARKDLGRRVW